MWTAAEIPDQSGKTIIVTGANTGLGYETALALYKAGANVVLACRNFEKAEESRTNISVQGVKGTLETGILDLSDLTLVKSFAECFLQSHTELHVLINNAGVATPLASKTVQGFELQFGVNFLGHFALTGYLYPLLKATPDSRVVTLSSMGYQSGAIDFNNLRSEKDYDPMREYRQSKLANLLFSLELHRRIEERGDKVLSIAAQPGANNTELTRHLSEETITAGKAAIGEFMEPAQGALSSLFAATSAEAQSGKMYEPHEGYRGYPAEAMLQGNALDEAVAGKLREVAEELTSVHYPV